MIKKTIVLIMMFILLCIPTTHVMALENSTQYSYIEQVFDDGSYIEITIDDPIVNTRASVTKSKTATYKGSDGTALWSVTVKGTFSYNGSSSSCTSSSVSTKNYSTKWKLSNAKASKSGSTAFASVIAKLYNNGGSLLGTINKTVKLTCDKNGNLS